MQKVELLERVKALTGPSGDADFDLLEMAGLGYDDYTRSHYEFRADTPNIIDRDKPWRFEYPTRSIDAALALVERKIPDFAYQLTNDYGGYNRVHINVSPGSPMFPIEGMNIEETAETMPLAILAALLTALISQEQS